MRVDACSFHGILVLFIYAAVETYVGRKRPWGAGSIPELVFISGMVGLIVAGLAWYNFKERSNERSEEHSGD